MYGIRASLVDGGEIRGAGNAWICPEVYKKLYFGVEDILNYIRVPAATQGLSSMARKKN